MVKACDHGAVGDPEQGSNQGRLPRGGGTGEAFGNVLSGPRGEAALGLETLGHVDWHLQPQAGEESVLDSLPRPARGAGTLIPSAQRLVWAAKQALGKAALGALFA